MGDSSTSSSSVSDWSQPEWSSIIILNDSTWNDCSTSTTSIQTLWWTFIIVLCSHAPDSTLNYFPTSCLLYVQEWRNDVNIDSCQHTENLSTCCPITSLIQLCNTRRQHQVQCHTTNTTTSGTSNSSYHHHWQYWYYMTSTWSSTLFEVVPTLFRLY